MSKLIVIDANRCLACRTCELECAMAHSDASTLAEAVTSDTPPQSRVHVEPCGQFGIPLQCRHCEDAPCMTVCPTGAITRQDNDDLVLLDTEMCIGCKFCVLACPFGIIDMARDGKAVIKCDLCVARLSAGEEPACVAGCPTHALAFRELDECLRERRRKAANMIAEAAGLPDMTAGEGDHDG